MKKTPGAIRDLTKPPLPGDIFRLGNNEHVTVISVGDGNLSYVTGAVELSKSRGVPEELKSAALKMPYKMFRKWLATMAAGHSVDTPPPV
jgi:hypothetical protein